MIECIDQIAKQGVDTEEEEMKMNEKILELVLIHGPFKMPFDKFNKFFDVKTEFRFNLLSSNLARSRCYVMVFREGKSFDDLTQEWVVVVPLGNLVNIILEIGDHVKVKSDKVRIPDFVEELEERLIGDYDG